MGNRSLCKQRNVKLNYFLFFLVVFLLGFSILYTTSSSLSKNPFNMHSIQKSDICDDDDLCCRLKNSISSAAKKAKQISSPTFPPREWAGHIPSRATEFDNYTTVSGIFNDQSLDIPFELGPIVNRSIPTLPFFANASKFHPCCHDFLANATMGEQTFENIEFDLADFFRALGNNSRLLIAGDSVSRGSTRSALCALVAAGADFHYMKWNHDANEELQNQTRDNDGHAPTICKTWFRAWSSYHNFSLPHPGMVAKAKIPLEGKLLPSDGDDRTFHQLVWQGEISGEMHLFSGLFQPKSRVALLLNFGLHWNLGGSVNKGLAFQDDSPSKLYGHLVNQFQKLASLPDPPYVFWRETTPQLFKSFEIERSKKECEKFPDIYVGGSYPDGGCGLGLDGRGWNAGLCQRNNSQSLGWNTASPFRWRQRLAAHAATVAGLQIIVPPVQSHTAKALVNSTVGEVLWIPFHDAALQDRALFQESGDCVHPDPFRRAFWSVIWDGMARHIIERRGSCTD